jgi:hypothetical protein
VPYYHPSQILHRRSVGPPRHGQRPHREPSAGRRAVRAPPDARRAVPTGRPRRQQRSGASLEGRPQATGRVSAPIAWALARLEVRDEAAFAGLSARMREEGVVDRAEAQAISNAAWAFATVQHFDEALPRPPFVHMTPWLMAPFANSCSGVLA